MATVEFNYSWLPGQTRRKQQDELLFNALRAIHNTGSVQHGAREIGLSYRHVWGMLIKWQAMLNEPLVTMERGRGTRLTPFGEKLLWAEQRVNARLAPQLESLAAELEREFQTVLNSGAETLRVHASHDLALSQLRDLVNRDDGSPRLDVSFMGSQESLASLVRGHCDLAGFHVSEQESKATLAHLAYRRWLRPRTQLLVHFVGRQQGLIVARGNPLKIRGVKDLTRSRVRFVNRQGGSGTRLLLDQLLWDGEIDKARINGYDNEEFTHLAVAATIASGGANAGIGIKAAASRYNLDFIPLVNERYFLAVRKESTHSPAFKSLLAALKSGEFAAAVAGLPGYEAAKCGELVSIKDALPWYASTPQEKVK
ncbi:MAG: substrate-binding domain-containing protein [Burkholderiales bacterium]|nr:helix-turn-helix transcriptional regulator [Burkholderiales bacterium]MDQ3196833.1 helix-turn-helix transcriptional regulator [Pseudomonadota bacterium]